MDDSNNFSSTWDKKYNENTCKKVAERSENKATGTTGATFKIGRGTTDVATDVEGSTGCSLL